MMAGNDFHIVVLVSQPEKGEQLLEFASIIGHAYDSKPEVLDLAALKHELIGADHKADFLDKSFEEQKAIVDKMEERIRGLVSHWPADAILTDWVEDFDEMGFETRLAQHLDIDVAVMKVRKCEDLERILVPTGGGMHSFEGVRLAQSLSRFLKVPAQAIRVVRPPTGVDVDKRSLIRHRRKIRALTLMQFNWMDITIPLKVKISDQVVDTIQKSIRDHDLVIVGGTNEWRIDQMFKNSIPEQVAYHSPCSAIMVYAKKRKEVHLEDVFWERTIVLNMKPKDKWDAITMLVDTLVEDRQIPRAMRDEVLQAVFAREKDLCTATGRGVAIPHAALPQCKGLFGSIGICPEGVQFGPEDSEPTNFIFLLVTPADDYGRYLPVLSKIAHLMMDESRRDHMLKLKTPAEVIEYIFRQVDLNGANL